jgi:hypothetical protein
LSSARANTVLSLEQVPWRERLQTSLLGCWEQTAQIVTSGKTARTLDLTLLKQGPYSVTVAMFAAGERGVLKLFDSPESKVKQSYEREKRALVLMQDNALVTRITAFSDPHRFVMTRYAGDPLDADTTDEASGVDVARRIGAWIAQYDAVAPAKPVSGNWYSYLLKFGDAVQINRDGADRQALIDIPLCGYSLARNDVALHNFLSSPSGDLIACDFEKSGFRPRGWDYIMTFHALIQRFPDEVEPVLDAFSDAYSQAHRGALIMDEINQVARIMYRATATASQTPDAGGSSWQ